jgi:hypothetical protein
MRTPLLLIAVLMLLGACRTQGEIGLRDMEPVDGEGMPPLEHGGEDGGPDRDLIRAEIEEELPSDSEEEPE